MLFKYIFKTFQSALIPHFFSSQFFTFDILLLIGIGVGAYFVYSGNLAALQTPFIEALKKYDDTANDAADKTLVKAWDAFQQDVRPFTKLSNF